VGPDGNWVRVGDPNQAIYETFTTASPDFLRNFLRESGVTPRDLPDSGRSTASIIHLANELIRWTVEDHPVDELRGALTPPFIRPTAPDDPQPNPEDNPDEIFFSEKKYSPEDEIKAVIGSLKKWLPEHPDQTAAVLVPRNERGGKVVAALKEAGIEPVELLQSSLSTRKTADILARVLRSLNEPTAPNRLSAVYLDVNRDDLEEPERTALHKKNQSLLARCKDPENYLWPRGVQDWLAELGEAGLTEDALFELEKFRELIRRWQQAVLLPVDQLVLTIAQDLFESPAELALAHKLALIVERAAQTHPEWAMEQFIEEIALVARNERRLVGFSEEDSGFDPDQHKGEVVVATIHKAKGMEWDRVYLVSINNYDFPSLQAYDQYISEKYFVRGQLNLEAETLAALRALIDDSIPDLYVEEGVATLQARREYGSERLRLLFVGITRARRSLVMTWNTGRAGSGGRENQPALPFVHLRSYWEEHKHGVTG
jgi:DNA helicase-2/ATP-dependent DNA helicase PcrA